MNKSMNEEASQGETPSTISRRLELIAFLAIIAASLLTRLLPLSMSLYPFNNDGLTECSLAGRILSTGHLPNLLDGTATTHSEGIPVLNLMIAYIAGALGTDPFSASQPMIALVSLLSVGGIFMLGRLLTDDARGGIVASLMALMFGTFVFTTGSVWKEALGIGLLVMAVLGFMMRDEARFRALCFFSLLTLPLVHHLVAVMALLVISYMLVWRWFHALKTRTVKPSHFFDSLLVLVPLLWMFMVYSLVSFDRLQTISSPVNVALIGVAFSGLCAAEILVLSLKKHSKWTFAPIPGMVIVVVIFLDYSGYMYSYEPSAPMTYLLLVASFGVMMSLAWYGAEIALERLPKFKAIPLALLLGPVTIIGFSLFNGLSSQSQQVLYRSFDFADLFIFAGAAIAVSWLARNRRRAYAALAAVLVISLAISFPFGYYSGVLLGVRHDTQSYEVDGVEWLAGSQTTLQLISDERLSYIAWAMGDIPKDSTLPQYFIKNYTLPPGWFGALEDSYVSVGVNDYPRGFIRIPLENYTWTMAASDVLYLGGPSQDRLIIFATSNIGHIAIIGPFPSSEG